jgi:hypothetical protein
MFAQVCLSQYHRCDNLQVSYRQMCPSVASELAVPDILGVGGSFERCNYSMLMQGQSFKKNYLL